MADCKHSERPAVARCVACGQTVCHECRRVHKSKNYCFSCWPRKPKARYRSPTLALLLSAVPGLGHLYAGSYLKMLLFPALFFPMAVNHHEVPVLIPIFIFLFGIWDARMAAVKRNSRIADRRAGIMDSRGQGAGEGDWMIWGGALVLAFLFVWLPLGMGIALEPWTVWAGFAVVAALALVMGNGVPAATEGRKSNVS